MFFITPTIWPNGERIHGSLYTGASLGSETLDTNISIENVLLWQHTILSLHNPRYLLQTTRPSQRRQFMTVSNGLGLYLTYWKYLFIDSTGYQKWAVFVTNL